MKKNHEVSPCGGQLGKKKKPTVRDYSHEQIEKKRFKVFII